MRLFRRMRELEEQNRDLNGRIKELEYYMYKTKANELLKELSEKYGMKMLLQQDLFNRRFYVVTEEGKTICLLKCFNGISDVCSEIINCEAKIKAFMYDKIKEVVAEAAGKEGEESNDKE